MAKKTGRVYKRDTKQKNAPKVSIDVKHDGKKFKLDLSEYASKTQLAQKMMDNPSHYKVFHYIDNRVQVEGKNGTPTWRGQRDIIKTRVKERGANLGDSLNYTPDSFTINEATMYAGMTVPQILDSILFPPFLTPTICAKLLNDGMVSTLITKAPSVVMTAWIDIETTKKHKNSSDRNEEQIEEDKFQIGEFLKKHSMRDMLYEALYKMNGMGGSVIFIDTGERGEDLTKPLQIDKINLENFQGFRLVENWQWTITKSNWTQPLDADYMQPIEVFIYNEYIHASRLIFIKNRQKPISSIYTQQYNYATQADTERVMPYMQQYFARMNTTTNVQLKQNVMIYKTDAINLQGMNGADLIRTLNNFNIMRDNFGVIAVDYERGEVAVEHYHMPGWADLNAEAFALFAVIMDMPQSVIAKTPPPGFNASGDFDDMAYNQVCDRWRTMNMEAAIDKIFSIAKVVAVGEKRAINYTWKFGQLHKPKPEEEAKIFLTECQGLKALRDGNMISEKDGRIFIKEKYAVWSNMDVNEIPIAPAQGEVNV